ncbi:probable hexosyltransferase MUCI70 [Impatiens glandulifera]|uniref:probable hexosyltransferase MUCI70 n=1 Tax=Impatiens glandulifera TaxID=253017 RepID=UPI001FB0A7E4|nr:probable hexosyltransferase MUCI70 [Impatiens glandulifera]
MSSSVNNNNSISISISEDDYENVTNRNRVRVRRKNKKSVSRAKNGLTHRVVRNLLRCWPLLLFFPAAGLLLFQAPRTGSEPSLAVVDSEIVIPKKREQIFEIKSEKREQIFENKSESSLNRLEPITRIVHGVSERCLDLLPPEELEHLNIPQDKESSDIVKEVVYMSEKTLSHIEGNHTFPQQHKATKKFNFFTGFQTLEQRAKSFKVNETHSLNCGFYSDKGGFNMSHEDKNYLKECEIVVSTCAFGGGDDLYQPVGMTKTSVQKVCYVAFWDDITVAAQEASGHQIGEDLFIGKWRIILVWDLPFRDQRLNGKIPKMLVHRLFPRARYSIWVDSKSQFRRDPLGVLEALLWRSHSVLAISDHGARGSVYDEANAIVSKNKASPKEVDLQMTQYRLDGLPNDSRLDGRKALAEASVIVRDHTPLTNLFMCLWFNEVVRFTPRDQLSFPYVFWRLKELRNINMFPVCTRRDLVNSMGHIRKAKTHAINKFSQP